MHVFTMIQITLTSQILTKMKTMIKENYSEHLAMRLTPKMLQRFLIAAKKNNMPPAVFARWVLLNYLDEIGVK